MAGGGNPQDDASAMWSRRRRGRSFGCAPLSQINVTPFVDVMLVLLIIFMISAPMMTPGLSVNLPKVGARPLQESKNPLTLVIAHDGTVMLDDNEVGAGGLATKLAEFSPADRERNVYVYGDRTISYGEVARVMGVLKKAGFLRVSLVTQNEDQ